MAPTAVCPKPLAAMIHAPACVYYVRGDKAKGKGQMT